MTYNPSFDRTDWRAVSTKRLIEAARDSNHELCIALGERLDDYGRSRRDATQEIEELRDRLALATSAAAVMRAEINALEGERNRG